jgi:hypothetical protein
MPWDTDPFAQTARRALENAGPEERHAHYGDLELRVVTLGKDELEISGVFGRETLYICNPSPTLPRPPVNFRFSACLVVNAVSRKERAKPKIEVMPVRAPDPKQTA